MSQWYYESQGQVVGPLSSTQLLQKVRIGAIAETTRVRKDDSQWVNAGDVNGLFQAARRNLVEYHCPYCNGLIDRPPTVCLQCDREVTAAYRHREKVAAEPPPAEPPAAAAPDPSHNGHGESADGTVVHAVITWLKTLVREWGGEDAPPSPPRRPGP